MPPGMGDHASAHLANSNSIICSCANIFQCFHKRLSITLSPCLPLSSLQMFQLSQNVCFSSAHYVTKNDNFFLMFVAHCLCVLAIQKTIWQPLPSPKMHKVNNMYLMQYLSAQERHTCSVDPGIISGRGHALEVLLSFWGLYVGTGKLSVIDFNVVAFHGFLHGN